MFPFLRQVYLHICFTSYGFECVLRQEYIKIFSHQEFASVLFSGSRDQQSLKRRRVVLSHWVRNWWQQKLGDKIWVSSRGELPPCIPGLLGECRWHGQGGNDLACLPTFLLLFLKFFLFFSSHSNQTCCLFPYCGAVTLDYSICMMSQLMVMMRSQF